VVECKTLSPGATPLITAARLGAHQACKALVAHGAITDRENAAGVSALQAVLSETLQHPSMVQTLRTIIEIGAGVNRLGSDGCTPLMHAAKARRCRLTLSNPR